MPFFEKLIEDNILIVFLIIILIILIFVYLGLIIRYKLEKAKITDDEELPKRKSDHTIDMVEDLDTGEKKSVYISEDYDDLKKEAVKIKGLLKKSVVINYDDIKRNIQLKKESDNIKVVANDEEETIEELAFKKKKILDESINEDIKIEDDEPKFEKTELIDLDEVYEKMNNN